MVILWCFILKLVVLSVILILVLLWRYVWVVLDGFGNNSSTRFKMRYVNVFGAKEMMSFLLFKFVKWLIILLMWFFG